MTGKHSGFDSDLVRFGEQNDIEVAVDNRHDEDIPPPNAGANEQFIDRGGRAWKADLPHTEGSWGYVGGAAERSHQRIFETDDDPLYQTRQTGPLIRMQ